jgi:hypothetical protein
MKIKKLKLKTVLEFGGVLDVVGKPLASGILFHNFQS